MPLLKRISAVISLVISVLFVFVLGWYGISKYLSQEKSIQSYMISTPIISERSLNTPKLKIAAYNIAHGRGGISDAGNWQHNRKEDVLAHLDKIVRQINGENPDILILNETDFSSTWSFQVNQAAYIAEKCGFPYILEQVNMDISFPFYRFCFGNAVLSKYAITNEQFIEFKPYSTMEDVLAGSHHAAFCELKTPFGRVGLFAVHLEYRSEKIRFQCVESMADICSDKTFPILAAGDFNSTPIGFAKSIVTSDGQNAMSFLLDQAKFKSYLNQANHSGDYTFPSENPEKVIDWIIGKGNVQFSGSKTIMSDLSDHLMIVTEIELK